LRVGSALRWVPIAAALLLFGCGTASEPKRPGGPALWEVSDGDTRVLMLGTLHALPDDVKWLNGRVAEAADGADELVLEIPPDEDREAQGRAFARLAARAPDPIEGRIPAGLRDELRAVAAQAGQPLTALDHMDDWAVAVLLSGASVSRSGMSRENGVEERLTRRFRANGRPIRGLETAEQQFALFDALPPTAQRSYLIDVLRDEEDGRDPRPQAVRDWARGDADALGRLVNAELATNPALREAILVRRNHNWASWIERRLDRPGTVLLAVGAGHLAGAESVQAMLAERGLTVRRVR